MSHHCLSPIGKDVLTALTVGNTLLIAICIFQKMNTNPVALMIYSNGQWKQKN